MSDIRLFIASSSHDTEHERYLIGDVVRRLNDKYEPRGYRIRLGCWEDFTPEFTGTRKQSEYNENLIKKSQLFVALFREVCGRFTQEEIKVWTNLGKKPLVLDIQGVGVNKTNVLAFLASEGLAKTEVATDEDIVAQVTALVEEYIRTATSTQPSKADIKQIYATIPDDRANERLPFSNLVRGMDDIAEEFFHLRCRLTQKDLDKVSTSHYYAAILKDSIDTNEELEIQTAITESVKKNSPHVAIYFNYGDLVCRNHPVVERTINSSGLFNEKFDGICRVRYNLLRWLIQQSVLRIDLTDGIDVQDDWFVFRGLPIIPLSRLGITSGTALQQLSELIKQLSFAVLGANTHLLTADLDLNALDEQLMNADAVFDTARAISQAALEKKRQLLDRITECISSILSTDVSEHTIQKLTALIDRKEQLQKDINADPHDLIRTQMLLVQVHDTYPKVFATTGIDIDAQYKKVVDTADQFGIIDPTVEMMRMNYANYLSRMNHQSESLQLYKLTMANLDRLDDNSKLIQLYIVHLYVIYINHLIHLGEIKQANEAINQLVEKTEGWNRKGNRSSSEELIDKMRITACQLRVRPIRQYDENLVEKALSLIEELNQMEQISIPEGVWDDLFCDFPNCLATYFLDTASPKNINKNFRLAYQLLLQVANNATHSAVTIDSRLRYAGNAYHNMGFLLFNNSQIKEAQQRLKKALQIRRDIYEENHYEADRDAIAQTLLLLGATYVHDRVKYFTNALESEALAYADECLAIYTALNTDHFLEQETCVYKAKLLRGSILFYSMDARHRSEGIALMKECQEWNVAHPENSYKDTFDGVAGVILKHLGIDINHAKFSTGNKE